MLGVYRELGKVLKPNGVVALVLKDPVKSGRIRALSSDTIGLMEAAGFELIEHIHAMLAQEWEEGHLFAGMVRKRHEKKSFFKRLFERKRPDLRVDHESVLFFRRIG